MLWEFSRIDKPKTVGCFFFERRHIWIFVPMVGIKIRQIFRWRQTFLEIDSCAFRTSFLFVTLDLLPIWLLGGTYSFICAMVKSRYIGDAHPTFNRNPYNGYYINPHYWVDDHPLLYGNNGSLDDELAQHPTLELCPIHRWEGQSQ